jgi:hypothetical protein
MSLKSVVQIAVLLSALAGCAVTSAVTSVVTAPVKIGSKAVDLATTSQSESDEKRGRELRRREERLGQLERQYLKQDSACVRGDGDACARRDAIHLEMQALMPGVPAQPN